MPNGLIDIFGPRGWGDVHHEVTRRLTRRYAYRLSTPHDIEEAVAGAMLDLVDYWVHLASSVDLDDPERNFKWATWRGTRTATQFLLQRINERSHVVSLSDDGVDSEYHSPRSDRLADCTAGPEELACGDDEAKQVRDLIDSLPAENHRRWLGGLLEGLTVREAAKAEGVPCTTEWRRRRAGVEAVRVEMEARELWP